MTSQKLHDWDLDPGRAIALQQELARRIIRQDQFKNEIRHIAGVDMAINEGNGLARAAVVLLSYPDLEREEQHIYEEPIRMPYVPGLLSFRELPSVLGAIGLLKQQPDLVMVDGQGIAHPRRLGIAAHLGLWLDIPAIGCAKSILRGHYDERALGEEAGSWVLLVEKHETLGAAARTRSHVKPMFISLGHRISLETSLHYVFACSRGYRLPEPTRLADKLSKDNAYQEPAEVQQDALWP